MLASAGSKGACDQHRRRKGTLDLHEAAKGRGIGDCWASHDWTWSGDRLALVSASESDCRLFEAGGLMVELCRAQVK